LVFPAAGKCYCLLGVHVSFSSLVPLVGRRMIIFLTNAKPELLSSIASVRAFSRRNPVGYGSSRSCNLATACSALFINVLAPCRPCRIICTQLYPTVSASKISSHTRAVTATEAWVDLICCWPSTWPAVHHPGA